MGRKTTGTLFKRGSNYYVRFQLDGKRVDRALKDEQGNPVTDRAGAEDASRALLSPLAFKDKAKRLRELATALRTAEDEATEAERTIAERREREEAERNKLPIAKAWERFPYIEATRGDVARALSPQTVKDNASHWRTFAAWAEGQGIRALEDIEARHVAAFSKHLREEVTANRHNKILATCSVVCRLAGRPDPFAAAKKYRAEPVHRENLEPDEIRAVIEAAPGEFRRLLILATFTGLRLGDCATMQWEGIHLDENGGRIIRRTSKTRKTVSFPIHPDLRAELERTPPEERAGAVCPELAELYHREPQRISKRMRQLFEGCELETRIEAGKGRKRAASVRGFHSLRHSFATECARAGVPLGLVQSWLGHNSPEITRIYENWSMDRDAGRILSALPTLALPEGPDRPAPIEGEAPPVEIETERDQLARLARELPAARVRDLLDIAAAWGRK